MSSVPASTLAPTSTPVIDILARFPVEIINRILDGLHPSLIYFHLFVEPKSAPIQSSSEECQRVRELHLSQCQARPYGLLTYAVLSNDQETVKQMLERASTNAETSGKKPAVVEHAPPSLWKLSEEHKDGHGKMPLILCLTKMAGLKDMTLYVPTFKQVLVAKGADPQAFSTQYETVLKDLLDEDDSAFWKELIEQIES